MVLNEIKIRKRVEELILYFDESGFTGERLLDDGQKTFAYSSVAIDPLAAESIASEIITKYKIQNGELKGVKLIRRDKGKEAILEIIKHIQESIKISISDKRYALAAKFYEYIFEPVLASKSSIFYQLNFHKYISNVLYISFTAEDDLAEDILRNFENLMRTKDLACLEELVSLIERDYSENSSLEFFIKILKFIKAHHSIIYEEIRGLPKWTNDLTVSALNSLFSSWGQSGKEMIAFCDASKPLNEQRDIFNNMIGREDIIYHPFIEDQGEQIPITYNLQSINLVDSKLYPGVQLADIVATASTYAFQMYQEQDEYGKKLQEVLLPRVVYGSIVPDFSHLNLEDKKVQLNALIFEELITRSEQNVSVLDEIEDFIRQANINLTINPIF